MEPDTRLALLNLRKAAKLSKKRKQIDDLHSSSKKINLELDLSCIPQANIVPNLQMNIGAERSFADNHNSTPVPKDYNDDAPIDKQIEIQGEIQSSKAKCPLCENSFKSVAKHKRFCKVYRVQKKIDNIIPHMFVFSFNVFLYIIPFPKITISMDTLFKVNKSQIRLRILGAVL